MTVKELITLLSKCDGKAKVEIHSTYQTDNGSTAFEFDEFNDCQDVWTTKGKVAIALHGCPDDKYTSMTRETK